MSRSPRLVVVGAGLGGLVLARVLQRAGREVVVLERETGPEARTQGGTLDMHPDTGQRALAAAGLLDAFAALARPEGQEMRLLDRDATVLRHQRAEDAEDSRPEIDRGQLRGLLLDALAPGTVRWGHGLDRLDRLERLGHRGRPGSGWRLHGRDGGGIDADLVVGADGGRSAVRSAVSGAEPAYTGVTFLDAAFTDVDRRHPALAEIAGQGLTVVKGDGRALFLQRSSSDRLRAYVGLRVPTDWLARAGVDGDDAGAVRAHLLELFAGWHPTLRRVLTDHEGPLIHRPLCATPVPHAWPATSGLTLLGDAAHLMPPLGLGANLAMLDGAELAAALAEHDDPDAAITAYEAVMRPRSDEAAAACLEGLGHLLPLPAAA